MLKVLNLYSGLGGNRQLWKNVKVTAVENNKSIAEVYQEIYPDDKVIITDAHQYLLEHYKEFDFIWSSPPCQSHSDIRRMGAVAGMYKPVYPDIKLYEEIIFLEWFCKSKYVVENVKSYYQPLREPQYSGRHCFWANFNIPNIKISPLKIREVKIKGSVLFGKKLTTRKDTVLRSMVNPELGLHIFNCAFNSNIQKELNEVKPNSSHN